MFEEMHHDETHTDGHTYVPFRVNGSWFTVDVRHVVKVALFGQVFGIPNTPEHVLGYSLLRGETFVTCDLASLLAVSFTDAEDTDPVHSSPRLVVLEANGMRIAVPVDKTAPLMTISMTQISDVSEETEGLVHQVLWGQFEASGCVYRVLNVPFLLEHGCV